MGAQRGGLCPPFVFYIRCVFSSRIKSFIKSLHKPRLKPYASETSKVRHLVEPFCEGKGCDIGFGGDKIVKLNCDGIDLPMPYAFTGNDPVDIACEVGAESIPVPDCTYDYVYSSHLIEDFQDTTLILREFCRILKPKGRLILVFPDQVKYEKFCTDYQLWPNIQHKHPDMGMEFMLNALKQLSEYQFTVEFSSNCEIDYNVIMVLKMIEANRSFKDDLSIDRRNTPTN